MHMIVIGANFEKHNVVAVGNLKAHLLQRYIYGQGKDDTPIFGWTDQMIDQDRDIVAFVNILAHAPTIRR